MIFFLLLGVVLGAVLVIFVLQNTVPITVTFLTWQISGSLSLVLLFAIVSGMIVALLILLPSLIRDEWRHAQLKKDKRAVEDELATTKKVITDVAAGRAALVEQTTTTTTAPTPLY